MFEIRTLEDVALLRETFEVECKLAAGRDGRGKLPDDFWRTYSAFANTRGGLVILGLRETGEGFEVAGIPEVDRIRSDLFNLANNREKVSANLLTDDGVRKVMIEEHALLLIDVPAAGRKDKPVHIGANPMTGTYRRLNDGDRPCEPDRIRRMLAEQAEDTRDNRVLRNFGLEDLSSETVRSFRQAVRDRQPDHPFLDADDQTFLRQVGAIRRNRDDGGEGLTVAGLLMFGQYQSIQDEFPNYFLDYQERTHSNADVRWVDRITLDGTWPGNLFEFYRRTYRKLVSDLKVPFALQDGRRIGETAVHQALREALVNALVHADYAARASVLVVKRPDMFSFRNPGTMRVPAAQAIAGGASDGRNRTLQSMFLLIGAGERAGSGVPRIYKGWTEQHWRPPALYDLEDPSEQTLLDLRMLDLIPAETLDQLRRRFGRQFEEISRNQRLVLATAATEGVVTHARMASICDMHPTDLTRLLQGLTQGNLLVQSGRTRATTYRLPDQAWPDVDKGTELDEKSTEIREKSRESSERSTELEEKGAELGPVGLGDHLLATLGSNHAQGSAPPIIANLSDLHSALAHELEQLARPVQSRNWVRPEVVSKAVLDLCTGRYLTLRTLAALLGRDDNYLRIRVLGPMLRDGRLLRAFPDAPRDPRQAYTTARQENAEQASLG